MAAIFRDHGNRSDRRHARLKYLLAEWGIDAVPRGVPAPRVVHARRRPCSCRRCRSTITWAATASATAAGSTACSFRAAGSWTPTGIALKTALHEIVTRLRPGIRLTAQQNLLLTDLDADGIETVERILQAHGVTLPLELSGRAPVLDGLPRAADLRAGGGGVRARDPGDPRPVRGRARRGWASATCRSPSG